MLTSCRSAAPSLCWLRWPHTLSTLGVHINMYNHLQAPQTARAALFILPTLESSAAHASPTPFGGPPTQTDAPCKAVQPGPLGSVVGAEVPLLAPQNTASQRLPSPSSAWASPSWAPSARSCPSARSGITCCGQRPCSTPLQVELGWGRRVGPGLWACSVLLDFCQEQAVGEAEGAVSATPGVSRGSDLCS